VGRQREIVESLVHRQNVGELHHRLRALHPADIAYILEALPGRTARSSGSRSRSRGRAACCRSWGGPCAKT
jgi:Mg/Co/Ni transporter MgtE